MIARDAAPPLGPESEPAPRRPSRATTDGVVDPIGRVMAVVVIGGLLVGSVIVFLLARS